MIKLFWREHRATGLFFFFCLIWMNGLLLLEVDFKSVATIYLNSTLLFFFALFIGYRFLRDYRRLYALNFHNAEDYMDAFKLQTEQAELDAIRLLHKTQAEIRETNDFQVAWVHEVKTPLTAMRLLLDELPSSETKQQLEVEWLRIHLLVDQSLHTLRLSAAEHDLLFEKVSIRQAIIKEVQELQNWCFLKELEIDLAVGDDVLVTDEKWLRFIVRQILSNAVKYSHTGGLITIRYTKNELVIHDEGIGIRMEDLPRIFEKGFTGSTGRKQSASTGMGLFLANQTAKKLGLTLQATSYKGTDLIIRFPEENTYAKVRK